MKKVLFILCLLSLPITAIKPAFKLAVFAETKKEKVKRLTDKTLQIAGYMKEIFDLHESGISLKLNGPVDSLNVDFGIATPSTANKKILRKKFRISAQIIKDTMDQLLIIVPE